MLQRPRLAVLTRVAPFVGLAIGIVGLAFVVRTIVDRFDEVSDAFAAMDTAQLVASVVLGLSAMWWIGRNWVAMLTARGHVAPPKRAMNWYFTGQLGKYVPGGIWPIVGRAELAVRGGVARPAAYGATTASMAATYAAATLVTGVASLAAWSYPAVGVAVLLALCVAAAMTWWSPVRTVALRIAEKVGLRVAAIPSMRHLAVAVALHVPAWLLVAASTWVTARAFDADIGPVDIVFASTASWLAGFVVVGVPGGIGVREAVFTALAAPAAGSSVAVAVALASRVVFVVVDLTGTALAAAVAGGTSIRERSTKT